VEGPASSKEVGFYLFFSFILGGVFYKLKDISASTIIKH
jgi:hypothetical protein